ncbi:MAG TPA: DUF6448 family protein [Ramlibacter sp.]|nr:DUF6448 family protein [Ramlibacter sp.]
MTRSNRLPLRRYLTLAAAALALTWGTAAQAHCDTLDGPVVSQARKALDSGNVNLVLGWVQKKDEAEIRNAFQKAVAVRKANGGAKELADMYFFETLVRVHRAGEGAPYTGLKPAGEIEPPIAAADKSIETGKLEPVGKMVIEQVEHGLHQQFEAVARKKTYNPNDVGAARAYVGAYVTYVHYVEGLYNAAASAGGEHAQHAQPVQDGPAAPQHSPATKAAGHAH